MASATEVEQPLHLTAHGTDEDKPMWSLEPVQLPIINREADVLYWAEALRQNLANLHKGSPVAFVCSFAPRRRSHDENEAALAVHVAQLLYASPSHSSLPALIKYEKDRVSLRRAVAAQERLAEAARHSPKSPTPKERVAFQGPWDEKNDPWQKTGPPSLPMPVAVSDHTTLEPFFRHLASDGGHEGGGSSSHSGEEPYYSVKLGEWEKGVLYEDGRMDLCKQVVGPRHIGTLMTSLESNTHVRHFLLGNNLIGPTGAENIASYMSRHPNQIDTWYLAGNCINSAALDTLVTAWTTSSSTQHIWLKRNPLGHRSAKLLFELITKTPNLVTLDLEQTELGDDGVEDLFTLLTEDECQDVIPLKHIYLNANGIAEEACRAIASFLTSKRCRVDSLYLSNNPIGAGGALALAEGLRSNTTILRLGLRSCGLKSEGAVAIIDTLQNHPHIMTLDIGHSYAASDLGSRHNFYDDRIASSAAELLLSTKTMRCLDLGITGMTSAVLDELAEVVCFSKTLFEFKVSTIWGRMPKGARRETRERMADNVQGKSQIHFLVRK
ncbi:MAG: hypothetical protein Q9174_001644 [Haloplaca sp. 1 TL-2023]